MFNDCTAPRRLRSAAFTLTLASRAAGLGLLAIACHAVSPAADAKLGPGVRESLARDGAADVIVALTSDSAPEHDAAATRAAIARAQDAVLSALDTADFQLRQRYAAVPALAGTLRSTRVLDRLLVHPFVRRVDLDAGGGGTGVP